MRAKRTDKAHAVVLAAIRAIGCPCMSLHAHGGGLEDIIVGIDCPVKSCQQHKRWLLVEVKTPNKSGTVKPSKFTPAQRAWYAETQGYPRIIVTSAQDAVDQIRRLQG